MEGRSGLLLEGQPNESDSSSWRDLVWSQNRVYDLVSPGNLNIQTSKFTKVKLRIINNSPETDGFVFWKNDMGSDKLLGPVRFTMKPNDKDWQEVICSMDTQWTKTVNQIIVRPAQMWWCGDIWIDWIAVTSGPLKKQISRPDLISKSIVPQIDIPGISQEGFEDAFSVLDECLVTDVPMMGFNYPFLAPGGIYGQNWWQLDGSLNIAGAKWVNQNLVEDIMRGFSEVQAQNPDGRIDLWGGSPARGQVSDVSSIPRYFEAAWDVARRTGNRTLQQDIYTTMKKYLGYWFSDSKRDQNSGLITAVFEESFGGQDENPRILAPVDLNVAVAIGCYNTSQLGRYLGYKNESSEYFQLYQNLSESINQFLWNDERGVYLNYNIKKNSQYPRLICSTFDPLQIQIAPKDRAEKLIETLQKTKVFNWGIRPVTSIAMTEPEYVEAEGQYDGRGWLGDLWTMRNIPIINGLKDAGQHELCAELNWSTINTFHSNYCEFVVPSTGSGEGVQRYGWSASQYIQAVIEYLFGIDYDNINNRIRIFPHLPKALTGKAISIRNLVLPNGKNSRMDLYIKSFRNGKTTFDIKISGELPESYLEIYMPGSENNSIRIEDPGGKTFPIIHSDSNPINATGTRMPVSQHVILNFYIRSKNKIEDISIKTFLKKITSIMYLYFKNLRPFL